MALPAPLFLLGATGVGKSAVALELVRTHPRFKGGAILALDAMQVYRGADIGTGKPGAAERAEIPHGGLDLVDFGTVFDVAQYLEHAAPFLREQEEAGRPVLIVGGTGLYFRALTRGLCEAPPGSPELRAELGSLSPAELRERLRLIDPEMLARVDAGNPRRLVRAIEVMETTGRSLSDWQQETTTPLISTYEALWLEREKKELHARIEARIEQMFATGWREEVRSLMTYSPKAVRAFPGIGYRQIAEDLRANPEEEEKRSAALQGDILVATRQYAKRQLTWFAREPTLRKVMLSGSSPLPAALFPPS